MLLCPHLSQQSKTFSPYIINFNFSSKLKKKKKSRGLFTKDW